MTPVERYAIRVMDRVERLLWIYWHLHLSVASRIKRVLFAVAELSKISSKDEIARKQLANILPSYRIRAMNGEMKICGDV